MKEKGIIFNSEMVRAILEGRKTMTRRPVKPQPPCSLSRIRGNPLVWTYTCSEDEWKCPFGLPGDRLWVRETHDVVFAGYKDGRGRQIIYRATNPDWPYGWTSSIHMPRWASRITLEITNIRVERVQEIMEEDALKEGMAWDDSVYDFSRLWDSLYGKGTWERNEWVWVISFKQLEGK